MGPEERPEREGKFAVGECPRGLLLQGGAEYDYESVSMDMTSNALSGVLGVVEEEWEVHSSAIGVALGVVFVCLLVKVGKNGIWNTICH